MTYYLMNTNVYNIVWADDEIDAILDEVIVDLKENGFNIVGTAHDGKELEERLSTLTQALGNSHGFGLALPLHILITLLVNAKSIVMQ